MKVTRSLVALVVMVVGLSSSVRAALVESVESSRASAARQKVDAFLSEKIVAGQLTALGISREQVSTRLARLSESQLQQLAAQVDLIRAGGTIQGGGLKPLGPLGYLAKQFGIVLYNFYQLLFSWGYLK
ncbi:MAG: PA2779 family protein [Verrucomicrobiia bacterium]